MTTQEKLDQVNAAITAIETGAQSYKTGNLSVTRANLSELYKERRQLQQQLISEQEGCTFVAEFDRR